MELGTFWASDLGWGETEGEHCLFERARGYAASTTGLQLPIVRQHRDFRPVNIIRNERGEIAVVDWEGYRAGPAFCDLFHVLFQWHPSARRQQHQTIVNSIERLLFEPTEDAIGDVIHEVVASRHDELFGAARQGSLLGRLSAIAQPEP